MDRSQDPKATNSQEPSPASGQNILLEKHSKLIRWILPIVIIIATVLSTSWFLANTEQGIPMADSYIHFTYARNLVSHQEYSYNPGISEGIGSTTFLWVIILAGFQAIGIAPETSSVVLGIGLLAYSGILVYNLVINTWHDLEEKKRVSIAIIGALLTVLPGSMVWLALSGMETILFLCLAILSLKLYSQNKWIPLGIVLGLLALTRTEGLILAGAIGLVELVRQRRIPRELIITAVLVVIMVFPWILYLYTREGIFATASYQGRMVMVAESNARISTHPILEWLITINPIVYIFCWVALLLLYASGAAGMPGPVWNLKQNLLGTQIGFPIFGWVVVFAVCLPLLVLAIRYLWRQRTRIILERHSHRLLAAIVVWIGLHNLAYALFISQIGAAGRYAPMNHVLFWLALMIGAWSIKKKNVKIVLITVVTVLLGMSLLYWQRVYEANIEYNQLVRIAAAKFIDDQLPADTQIGATDLGPVRYFARQPVVDLIGHVNKEIGPFLESGGDFADYVDHKEICYLMLYGTVGEAGIDFAGEMGLKDDDRYSLITEARFEITVDDWRLGSEPLRNYMPAVEVYRVDWHESDLCKGLSINE